MTSAAVRYTVVVLLLLNHCLLFLLLFVFFVFGPCFVEQDLVFFLTPVRLQSKTLITIATRMYSAIDEHGSKIVRNSVFDCQLSPVGRQMAIGNSVSNDFDLRSSVVLTFSIANYPVW